MSNIMRLTIVCIFIVAAFANASNCNNSQHCSYCDLEGLCVSECENGFYGAQCNIPCSTGCSHNTCMDGGHGVEKCSYGCRSGYYGSRCQIRCRKPSVNETCQKCPGECMEGFCDLGRSCVSGCQNLHYGHNCTCEVTATCNHDCGENCTEGDTKVNYLAVVLSSGAGVCVVLFLLASFLMMKLMQRNRQPVRSEGGRTFRLDLTGGSEGPGSCMGESYIHAVDEHYA